MHHHDSPTLHFSTPNLAANANVAVCRLDQTWKITYANDALAHLVGYETGQLLIGMRATDFIFPEDVDEQLRETQARREGKQSMLVRRFRRKDGSACWCMVSAIPLEDECGQFAGSLMTLTDYNEQKRNDDARLRQLASLRALNEVGALSYPSLPDRLHAALAIGARLLGLEFGIVSHVDGESYRIESQISPADTLKDGQTFELGKTYCSITLQHDQVLAIPHMGASPYLGHPCYNAFRLEAYIGAPIRVGGQVFGTVNFSSPKPYERTFDANDQEFVALLARWVGAAIERDRAERRLAENERKLRHLYELSPLGIALWSTSGQLMEYNEAFRQMCGYSDKDLDRIDYRDLTIGHTSADEERLTAELTERGRYGPYEKEYRHKDGHVVQVRVRSMLVNKPGESQYIWSIAEDITERKQVQEALRASEARYRSVVDNLKEVVFQTDAQGHWQFLNPAWAEITGFPVEESIGKLFLDYVHPDDRQRNQELFEPLIQRKKNYCRHEIRYLKKDGGICWIEVFARLTLDCDGSIVGTSGTLTDITGRKQQEEKSRLATSVFTHTKEGIMVTADDATIIEVNEAFEHITGYSRNEVLGKKPSVLHSGRQDERFYREMWQYLNEHGYWQDEVWNRRKSGGAYVEMLTISAVRDAGGKITNYVGLFSDITVQKEHEQQLERIAHYDALTGLPNRLLLADRLHQAIAHARRRKSIVAIVYVDLDGFKAVNDTYGHAYGDRLLTVVAARMKQVVRGTDTVARLGGDEFVIVLNDLPSIESSEPMLTRLLAAAAEPVQVDHHVLKVSASIGVSYYPQAQDLDADQLMRQADQAMYVAKLSGKNQWRVFLNE